ncbi:uncharacterized protein KZ484_007373 [Pholidichthys leucotaenia]
MHQKTRMDIYLRETRWMIPFIFALPYLSCSPDCCLNFQCHNINSNAVQCVCLTIRDIPLLPANTTELWLYKTKIEAINEKSLANQDLLLAFSLTHSPLHTIHPRAFHRVPRLKSIRLSSNNLSILPPRVFSPLSTLKELYLDGNQLKTIAADIFEGLVELKELDLSENKLINPPSDVFNGLTNLINLRLGINAIKKLPPTIFHSLTNLRLLLIYKNKLERLEAGMFNKLLNLEELKLHQNQIVRLPPRVFWPLQNLQNLTLSSNQLQAIPEKSLYYKPKLSMLTIFSNSLVTLPEELMGHMPEMREFYLCDTNLTTVPGNLFANMSGLLRLNISSNNKLRELPSDIFCCLPNLEKLSLESNDLQYLHPQLFSKLTNLTILVLNNNKLESLPENIFRGLEGLLTIGLVNNKLKTVPGDVFQSNSFLKSLTLSGNPWECTCIIRNFARWVRHNKHIILDREHVMCHSPRLDSLHDEEFSFCNATSVQTFSPTYNEATQPFHTVLTTGQASPDKMTPVSETLKTVQMATQELADQTTTVAVKPTTSVVTTIPTSLHSIHSNRASPPFYDMLVIEQRPEFVHHNIHKGWVYVWFLPSNAALAGFLMFCYILLVATSLLLILFTIYGMCQLNRMVDKLKDECVHHVLACRVIGPGHEKIN